MNRLLLFIKRKIIIRLPVWFILLTPFIAYLIWEIYWYTKVGLGVIKWHTHLVEYVYVWLLGAAIFRVFGGSRFSERTKNFFLAFTSVVFALGIMETFLQITGSIKTYMETISDQYSSPYTPLERSWYHLWSPNAPHRISKPEYSYLFPTNSQGLPDREWDIVKRNKNQKRILALGDSFTEGDGAPYDSSYVYLLNKKLQAAGDSVYMMNGGVCGCDPFYNYVLLRDRLLIYQPDVILQVLATNDLDTDIILRGGFERFQKDGSQKFHKAPWWEPIYALSYISRLFFQRAGYDQLLRKGNTLQPEQIKILNTQVSDLFRQYAVLCKQNHCRLVVILRPDKGEILQDKYFYDFAPILNQFNTDTSVKVLDLLPGYTNYIEKKHTQPADYFWKHDGHHNATGYEMMAQTVFDSIAPWLKNSVSAN